MDFTKNVKIDEYGAHIITNGSNIHNDIGLSLVDYTPNINVWQSSSFVLDKDKTKLLDGNYNFCYIRVRKSGASTIDPYSTCSSNVNFNPCKCSSTEYVNTIVEGLIKPATQTIATIQHYKNYVLSDNYVYLETDLLISTKDVKGIYKYTSDLVFDSSTSTLIVKSDALYPVDSTYRLYKSDLENFYLLYDKFTSTWVVIESADSFDITTNQVITVTNSVLWSTDSVEHGSTSIFKPGSTTTNIFHSTGQADIIDGDKVEVKFNDTFIFSSHKFSIELTSTEDDLYYNVLLGL